MKNPKVIIILMILFFPLGLYLMWKNEIWSLQTRVIISLILFFPVGLYFMWKEKELWSKKIKIIISVFFGIILISGGDGDGSFQNEYCLTLNDYMGMGGRVDLIVKLQKLERDPNYKGKYQYFQIHNGGSDFDLYEKGGYTYVKSDDGKKSLVLVPTFKDGREMDYDWNDGLRENIMILLVDDDNFSSLTFDLRGFEGETLQKCE
jgi:hypothetical protein